MKNLTKTILMAVAVLALGATARANTITPQNDSFAPGTSITYQANLSSGQVQTGDGFTIFDVGGYTGIGNVVPAGWTVTTSPFGSPWGVAPGGPDNSDLNVTFTYTGATITANGSLGLFTIGTNGTTLVIDDWTSRDHDLAGMLGSPHTDQIFVPAHVPDGGSAVALLGMALAGIEVVRRKLRA